MKSHLRFHLFVMMHLSQQIRPCLLIALCRSGSLSPCSLLGVVFHRASLGTGVRICVTMTMRTHLFSSLLGRLSLLRFLLFAFYTLFAHTPPSLSLASSSVLSILGSSPLSFFSPLPHFFLPPPLSKWPSGQDTRWSVVCVLCGSECLWLYRDKNLPRSPLTMTISGLDLKGHFVVLEKKF